MWDNLVDLQPQTGDTGGGISRDEFIGNVAKDIQVCENYSKYFQEIFLPLYQVKSKLANWHVSVLILLLMLLNFLFTKSISQLLRVAIPSITFISKSDNGQIRPGRPGSLLSHPRSLRSR